MYDDDEDLELLNQYEDEMYKSASDNDGHSSDSIDSDLEEALMGVVQYGTVMQKVTDNDKGKDKKVAEVIKASVPSSSAKPAAHVDVQGDILQLDSGDDDLPDADSSATSLSNGTNNNDDDDTHSTETPATKPNSDQQSVTHYIDLTSDARRQPYMDEESSDEEEHKLNDKLQLLIEDQINHRQRVRRFQARSARLCFLCYKMGHQVSYCPTLCSGCGKPRHKADKCFGLRYCNRCKRRGHSVEECTNERELGSCRRCGNSEHHTNHCPSLLHAYVEKKQKPQEVLPSCYNCSEIGHYGDECEGLPRYLLSMPSVFSEYSLLSGNRYDTRDKLHRGEREHLRFSDSSSDVSTSTQKKKPKKKKKSKTERDQQHGHGSHSSSGGNTSHRRTDIIDRQLGHFFKSERRRSPERSTHLKRGSGNNNWRALGASIPQPTRSGTLSKKRRENDFPRGQDPVIPRPSSSGVIDLTQDSEETNRKRPRYRGGYSSRR